MLDYTQGSCLIALDIRHQEVYDFLDLKNLKGAPNYSSVRSQLFKKISNLLGIDPNTKTNVSNIIDDHEDILQEAYEYLTNSYQEASKELF